MKFFKLICLITLSALSSSSINWAQAEPDADLLKLFNCPSIREVGYKQLVALPPMDLNIQDLKGGYWLKVAHFVLKEHAENWGVCNFKSGVGYVPAIGIDEYQKPPHRPLSPIVGGSDLEPFWTKQLHYGHVFVAVVQFQSRAGASVASFFPPNPLLLLSEFFSIQTSGPIHVRKDKYFTFDTESGLGIRGSPVRLKAHSSRECKKIHQDLLLCKNDLVFSAVHLLQEATFAHETHYEVFQLR